MANHIQRVKSDVELPEDKIPLDPVEGHEDLDFVDGQKWSTKDDCKNSIRGLDVTHNRRSISPLKINKETRDKVRHATPEDYANLWGREDYKFHTYERGSHVAVKCKLFALPEDDIADSVSSYEEYIMKCEIMGKAEKMSEIDFEIYKY